MPGLSFSMAAKVLAVAAGQSRKRRRTHGNDVQAICQSRLWLQRMPRHYVKEPWPESCAGQGSSLIEISGCQSSYFALTLRPMALDPRTMADADRWVRAWLESRYPGTRWTASDGDGHDGADAAPSGESVDLGQRGIVGVKDADTVGDRLGVPP